MIRPRLARLLLFLVVLSLFAFSGVASAAGLDPEQPAHTGVTAVLSELVGKWALFAIALGVILIAFLVNRYAPKKRRRIRRVVILFGLYLLCFGATASLNAMGWSMWAERAHFVTALLQAFTLVNIVALAVFELLLPAVRMSSVSITNDIILGAAYIVATFFVLRSAGMNPSSVLTVSAVVTGFVGLSMQTTLSNVFGGLAIQLDDSIHAGDWIQLENGKQGKVKEIRWRHTVVETRDWDTIVVPNSALLSGNIMILGKREGMSLQHRMWVYFNVDFRFSPARVIEVVAEALHAAPIDRVASEPKPSVICYDFAKDGRDSFGFYAVRYWLTDLAVDDPTSSVIRTRIYSALRRAGIPLARPSSTTFVHLDGEDSSERRLERHRRERVAALRAMDVFSVLTDEEFVRLSDHLRYAPFTAGETMTKQGAEAHWLYILTAGSAEVRTHVEDAPAKVVATLQAPAFFGEMGMMTGEKRTADVVARSEVECLRLDKQGFQSIIQARPEIATAISETLASRRVELIAMREGLDAEAKRAREVAERQKILARIQDFFALRESVAPRGR